MNYVDYYKVLGVSQTATADEIKKSFRKLAVMYHPDKTKGDKAANEKFKAINDAHQVLSDPEKRKKYDQFTAERQQYERAGAQAGGFDWSKYAEAAGDAGAAQSRGAASAEDFESMFAGSDVDLFELLFGSRGGRRPGRRSTVQRGDDLNAETTLTLQEAYHGTTRSIQLDGQQIRVTIPQGIADKQLLRIPGKGMPGPGGGPPGDLYLSVTIAPHPEFKRKGNDLYRDFPVDLFIAVLGGKSLVKTLKGAVKVNIPSETPNHRVLRLHGLGMPVFGIKNAFGDLIASVDIQMPDQLTPPEVELFKQLSALHNK